MECVINEISHYVDASHKQACSDLEKASQFITKALQSEVQRKTALRMLIHRLEDRATENGRSLSEQTESNRQLKVQVDELQKQLKEKVDSLTQATKSIVILKLELRHLKKQMHSHEGSHRTIQEVTEWLQDGDSQPNTVKEGSVQQSLVIGVKKEERDADGYLCGQSGETDSPTTSSSTHIKSELLQEEDEMLDMAPVSSSEMSQSPPDPVKALRLSVQVVDFCETQDRQGTASEDNEDGEQPSSGNGSQLSPSIPKFTAIPETDVEDDMPYSASSSNTGVNPHQQDLHTGDDEHCYRVRNKHTDTFTTTPHYCKHCGQCFVAEANGLRQHNCVDNGSAAAAAKSFHCDQCNKRFTQLGSLKIHQRIHTGEKPYECVLCSRRFTQSGSLRVHLRTHTGEKPYRCETCGRRFSDTKNLNEHKRTHTGEKPFRCDQCGKSFAHAKTAKRHQLTHQVRGPQDTTDGD